jgi:energy-coupling factor transporter ATP-binding protein EcfA2
MSKDRIAERLSQAGLSTERFIQCQTGQKSSVDHTRRHHDEVSGEYGIYAMASDGVAILDIDDYDEIDDRSGLQALSELEPTLEQGSPHGGTHRIYAIQPTEDGRLISDVLEETFDVKNPKPSWGGVRTANQYVVGAGSQLNCCDKAWCDECDTEEGGHYQLKADRRIATHTAEEFVEVLKQDPALTEESGSGSGSKPADSDSDHGSLPEVDADEEDILSFAREADDKLDRLWRGNYSDYGDDRSEAECALAMKLGWWFQGDKQTVRRLMDRANTQKWAERDDKSYRESVLEAVDELSDYYDPSDHTVSDPANFNPDEVERGLAILESETTPESPAGELVHQNGCYGYEKAYTNEDGDVTEVVFDTVCNFTIETLSYLVMEDGQQLKLRIHPQHPMEDSYDARVEPSVFNSPQSFKEEIVCGRTTAFEPSNRAGKPIATILADIRRTVGSQMAPHREGTEFIGLSDDYSEWVTPEGSLTADGWAENPDYEYYVKTGSTDESGAIAQKWQPEREDGSEYDKSELQEMLELLPNIRKPGRGLPILGWFYAAPLKPLITDWSGEFNLLQVTGETGSGKTTTLQCFWQLFGADTNPFSASDTGFTIEKHMAESCGLPVWIDEYKPADIPDHRLDRLHRRLREVTRERTISKGTQTLDEITFTIRAPVVISGEQKFKEAAVRRRAVMTNLTQAATDDGTETVEAFGELTGTAYEDATGDECYPNGYDLSQHAVAYYQWMLQHDEETLESWWNDANATTKELLGQLGITVENTEQQGLQTMVFGTELFRRFAKAHNVDEETVPSRRELRAAIQHAVSNIGKDGSRREHTDEWLELLTLASNEGYLSQGEHYKVTDSRKHEKEVLDVHMPSAFSAVMKYTREFNVEAEYTTLSKGDYLDAFKNKSQQPESYVIDTGVSVRNLENGRKCVRFDPERASQKLGNDFTLSAFTKTDGEDEDEDGEPIAATAITDLDASGNPYSAVTVEVNTWDAGPEGGPAESGVFEDATGTIDVVDFFGCPVSGNFEEGGTYRVENARVSTYDGTLQLEIVKNTTEVTEIQRGVGHTTPSDPDDGEGIDASQSSLDAAEADQEAATDGGDLTQLKPRVQMVVSDREREHDSGVPHEVVREALLDDEHDSERVDSAINDALEEGLIYESKSDHYRRN